MDRPFCEEHDKYLFTNRKQAMSSLMGGLASKRMRVYPCTEHKGLYHLTKELQKVRNKERERHGNTKYRKRR